MMTVGRWLAHCARPATPVLLGVLLAPGVAFATPDVGQVRAKLPRLQVPVVANQGQVDARGAYYAPTFAGTLFVTRQGELVYALPVPNASPAKWPMPQPGGWTLTETFVDGAVRPTAGERSRTAVSVFQGNDPARWHPEVSAHEHVALGEVHAPPISRAPPVAPSRRTPAHPTRMGSSPV